MKNNFLKAYSLIFIVFLFCLHINADPIQTNVPELKTVFVNDFKIGCLLSYRHVGFSSDPVVTGQSAVIDADGGYLIKYHMNSMSPGNNMKTMYTFDQTSSANAYNAASAAEKDSINTHPIIKFNADLTAQLNWAKRQGFTFRGHTLVWHSSAPQAFFYTGYNTSNVRLSKDKMMQRMENYIHDVIKLIHESWPGLLSAIDVVNESVNDGTGTFRTSGNEWYATFNDSSYVMKAFEFARKYTIEFGETQIKLYYNDYNTHNSAKADGIVKLVKPIFQAGYLDGIGMQDHDGSTPDTFPTAEEWIKSYNKFDSVCTEMAVTEFDVITGNTNTPSAAILATQANQYAQLFKCFVDRSYFSGRGKIISVSKDGLNDAYTFKTNASSSLWDTRNQCKPSFYAVVNMKLYLDSVSKLIDSAQKLDESKYSVEKWNDLTAALTKAQNAVTSNYSADNSVVTALSNANDSLKAAIQNLKPAEVLIKRNSLASIAYTYSQNQTVYIADIPEGSEVSVYNLSGVLVNTYLHPASTITMTYIYPCIIRIKSANNVQILKVVN
jgi:endo-1,4-beta-xylanase